MKRLIPSGRLLAPLMLAACAGAGTAHAHDAPATMPPVAADAMGLVKAAVVDMRNCSKAKYPPGTLPEVAQGTTFLSLLIGTDGAVLESQLERSSGHPQLDEAARAALSICHFTPAQQNGQPVQQWATVAYVWEPEAK
ncbi:energy transducer TonB [Janthinobacterium sp. SUN073]|uniref:energy transducer TonB n=1 Tax=Janthinobacterium sp. SUN073 TaxID=3004102 RepID=UPI0025B225B7|nr:energy transducer TonB [Janthinobacterium sp. SUN073]MDN2696543.1 energy transducer TonB [Janthinobacterium sp. SUN073]